MNTVKLYNNDGTLSTQAQLLLSNRPEGTTMRNWQKQLKEFRSLLSSQEVAEFNRLRKNAMAVRYRNANPERVKQQTKSYRTANPEKVKFAHTRWRNSSSKWKLWCFKNQKQLKENKLRFNKKHPDYMNDYHKQRKAKDPLYRLQCNMRIMGNRVVKQLSLGKKPTCTEKWQGCSADELKAYLESLFTEGMSWDNYGEWHVDHIRPVSSFKQEEWKQINHYTNLQPLWAEDNLSKSDEY
jgi:hypothetical protein